MFLPEGIVTEEEKVKWHKLVGDRKHIIERSLKEVFVDKDAVKRQKYSGRYRWLFPCPIESCRFSSPDIAKHLTVKYRWNKEEAKLQITYFHNIFNHHTRINTYNQPKPVICFECKYVVERIDSHLSMKHHS